MSCCGLDQPQPLPELRFGDDLDRPLLDLPPRGLVEPVVLAVDLGQRELLLADDDQMGRGVGLLQHRRPVLADQLRGVAPRHAGQLADKRDALVLKNHRRCCRRQPCSVASMQSCQCGRRMTTGHDSIFALMPQRNRRAYSCDQRDLARVA